ncbi:MAG TPA: Gfo/Idh/MocA family oxidoreductase [Sphingobacteriaceae bacterium]
MKRRTFIKSAATISAFSILKPATVFGSRANSAIRLGFIGCGKRGMAVISSMSRNTNVNIVAMADLFDNQLQAAKVNINKLNAEKGFPAIRNSNIYQGSKAYLKVLNNKDVDAVLISSPCYTHPEFLEAAVAAGKHAYCEKPAAIDVEGCRRIEQLGERLNGKLSLAIGFQVPHATPYAEMITRIRRGDIGRIVNVQTYYLASEVPIKPYKGMSYDEARIRNHFHFRELSGGTLLDQGIHMLDICNLALQAHPISAIGSGGLNSGTEFGNAWNNYQVIYQYPDDIKVSYHSTQLGNQFGDVCARFIGTNGIAEAHYTGGVFITGSNPWDSGVARNAAAVTAEQRASGVFLSSLYDADANKHKNFISSIESGNYLNETGRGAESTLTAIMGRNAAETQDTVTWDGIRFSNEKINTGLDLSQFDK